MRFRLPLRRGELEKPLCASRRYCSTHCPGRMLVHAGGLLTSLGSVQFCVACRSHLRPAPSCTKTSHPHIYSALDSNAAYIALCLRQTVQVQFLPST